LFITATTSVYSLMLDVRGAAPTSRVVRTS